MLTSFAIRLIIIQRYWLEYDSNFSLFPKHYIILGHLEIFSLSSRVKADGACVILRFLSKENTDFINVIAGMRVPADGLPTLMGQFGDVVEQRILKKCN